MLPGAGRLESSSWLGMELCLRQRILDIHQNQDSYLLLLRSHLWPAMLCGWQLLLDFVGVDLADV